MPRPRRPAREALVRKALRYFPGRPRSVPRVDVAYKRRVTPALLRALEAPLRSVLAESRGSYRNLVVGLSGGVDSSTCLALACRVVGRGRSLAVTVDLGLPEHRDQTRRARAVARALGVPHHVVRGERLLEGFLGSVAGRGPFSEINATTRTIHGLVFQFADAHDGAVVACTDRSEDLLSRHMEYFYGQVAPLAPLYKTEVFEVARAVGLSENVVAQEPGCVEAWMDREVFGVGYEELDPVLYLMSERGYTPGRIQARFGGDLTWLKKVQHRMDEVDWRMTTRRPALREAPGGDASGSV